MIRDDIKTATSAAMKAGDKSATGTLRLIQSAIKNRDIELRTAAAAPDDDALVTEVLHTAGGELLAVRAESGAEILVPFVSAIVSSVSLADGVALIDPPEGLLDLGS